MRIGIYVDVAMDPELTGIGRHIVRLVRALADLESSNEYLLYYPVGLGSSPEVPDHFPRLRNCRLRPVKFPRDWQFERPRLWWNHWLPLVLRRDRVDVFHGPNHFVPATSSIPTVVTIHDLAYFRMEVHGEAMDSALRKWTMQSMTNATAVIALSENTRRDVEQCGVAPQKIRVIYGGGDVKAEREIAWSRVDEMRRDRNLPEQFFLYVGAIQPRKNVPLLVRAFAEARKSHGLRQELVLAGPQGAATEEVLKIAGELGIERQVHLLGYVDDWELPLLYKLATAFVLPTLYEGFTLVTLEAMAYGTPVVVTDTSSIREGVGDVALLVHPNDERDMANALNRVATDSDLRTSCIEWGKKRAAGFTWEKSAEMTLELYSQVGLRPARRDKARVRVGAL